MRVLLTARANIDQADIDGESPLFASSFQNKPDAMRLLIKARADVDRRTNAGVPPLLSAAAYGYSDPTHILVRAGADIDSADNDGDAEQNARGRGHHHIATFLADIREAGGYAQYSELVCR